MRSRLGGGLSYNIGLKQGFVVISHYTCSIKNVLMINVYKNMFNYRIEHRLFEYVNTREILANGMDSILQKDDKGSVSLRPG